MLFNNCFINGSRLTAASSLVLFLICCYFTLLLVPKWVPSIISSPLFFLYSCSLILLIVILVAVAGRSRPSMARIAYLSVAWFALVFVVYWTVPGSLPTGSYRQRFDPTIWQQPTKYVNGDITPRQKMLGDLVENVLPGLGKADIEEMLGPADDAADRKLIYELGAERDSMFPIDSESLVIRLDSSGRFASYYIYVD